MASYFDFHFHPLAKRFLSEFNDMERQNKQCTEPIVLPRIGKVVDALSGHILQSQASVTQCVQGGVSLGIATIVAIEYVFATRRGVLKLLEWEFKGRDVIAPLDNQLFHFVHEGLGSYYTLLNKELSFYQWVAKQTNLRHQINLLTRKSENGLALQEGKLNVALAIEGGHGLSKSFINKFAGEADPVKTVQEFRLNKTVDFLYLTLTHLSHVPEQLLCSHAYGFKMVKDVPEARPQIKGLTPLGKLVVRACMDTQENKYPILLDIKHMSLQGRREFYAYRRELIERRPDGFQVPTNQDGTPWWPIIATHMGVMGYSISEMRNFIKEYGIEKGNEFSVRLHLSRKKAAKLPEGVGLDNVYFNPATVGLCDEDIEEIVRSRGLIGISLDARILGYEGIKARRKDDYDYVSRDDFAQLFPDLAQKLPKLEALEEEAVDALRPEKTTPTVTEGLVPGLADRSKRELYLFCLNVLHVVAVINRMPRAERYGKRGWDYICLGSDYDGLIDSIQAANTAVLLPHFEQELQGYLPQAVKAYTKAHDDVPELLSIADIKAEVKQVLRQLFYGNGERFLREWWGVVEPNVVAAPVKAQQV